MYLSKKNIYYNGLRCGFRKRPGASHFYERRTPKSRFLFPKS